MVKRKDHRVNEKTLALFQNKIGEEVGSYDPLKEVDVFLSPQNAARYLDVSVKFIYELMHTGQIQTQPVGGRLKRIRKGTLDKWLTTQAMKFERSLCPKK